MPDEELKAKVFISCGQRRGTDEERIAKEIKEFLEKELGYEGYVALDDQTVKGIPEAILYELETSEYFLFIDFKREGLVPDNPRPQQVYDTLLSGLPRRGSLFSHQELAVASYLKMPIIAFHEEGVERDGLANFELVNSIPLKDRRDCVQVVAAQIENAGWEPRWKNQLRLERDRWTFREKPTPNTTVHCHIYVGNLHHREAALGCQTYLERARRIDRTEDEPLPTIELKWAGYEHPAAHIFPGSQYQRPFDAFFMWCDQPHTVHASSFGDHPDFRWELSGPGQFQLTYVVYSINFPPARITCELILADNWHDMYFQQIPNPHTKGEPDQ